MLFTMRVRRQTEHPDGASRCPCGRVMPVFDGLEATVGAEVSEVLVKELAIKLLCPCGTPLIITLTPDYRMLRWDAEGGEAERS